MNGTVHAENPTLTPFSSRQSPVFENGRYTMVKFGLVIFALLFITLEGFHWDALAGSKRTDKTSADSGSTTEGGSQKEVSGEELWSNNCRRCHNTQPATMYS